MAHDPTTIEAVARAIERPGNYSEHFSWDKPRSWCEAVAALDALTALGWRGPLTKDERQGIDWGLAGIGFVLDPMIQMHGSEAVNRARDALRAFLDTQKGVSDETG